MNNTNMVIRMKKIYIFKINSNQRKLGTILKKEWV